MRTVQVVIHLLVLNFDGGFAAGSYPCQRCFAGENAAGRRWLPGIRWAGLTGPNTGWIKNLAR